MPVAEKLHANEIGSKKKSASISVESAKTYFTGSVIRNDPTSPSSECFACIERSHADDIAGTQAGTNPECGCTSGSAYQFQSPFAKFCACIPAA